MHTGRKTRAMVAAEEKAAAEAGNTAVNANVAATQTVKVVKPAAAKVNTEEPAKLAKPVKEAVKPVKSVKSVKPSVTKAKTVEPVKMAQPVKETVKTVKPAATKVKTVEPAEMAQPVKGNTLKSASNALKALRGAAPTNQDDTNDTTGEVPTSTTKPAIMQPATATPAVTNDITTKPAATIKTKAATTSATKATATSATKATATAATSAKVPRATMSMAQAAEFIKTFICFRSSKKTPFANAHVTKKHVTKKHRTKKRVVKEAVDPSSIPVFSVQPPQAVVDAELTKWLLADSKKPTPWGTQIEPVGPENMASDFEAMGFSSDKVKELVVMKEPRKVDGLMQLVPLNTGAGSFVPGTGPEPPKRARRAAKYHDLKLFEDNGESLLLPPHTFTRLHLLTSITRLGSIRSSQAIPCRARRAAFLHHQMGHVRAWQRSRPRHEHEDEDYPLASHTARPAQPHRRIHTLRPKDRRLDPHQEPQQEALVQQACPSSASPRPWRQAQRRPCRRLRGTTTRSQGPSGQKDQHQAQGR